MNKNKNTFSKFLTITSFNITILSINNNSLLANLHRNTFNYKEEENSFSYEPDEAFDDEIAKNSPIYTWRKEYFLFVDRKIDAPNINNKYKTTLNIFKEANIQIFN